MKKHFYFLLFLLIAEASAHAQRIQGTVHDEKGAPLAFVNAALHSAADSSLLATVITDKSGAFELVHTGGGRFYLRFSTIGFFDHRTPAFDGETDTTVLRPLGTIVLRASSKTLSEVTVTSLRPPITQLPDRLVVGVQGTALAAGTNAFAVLSRAPGVFIDGEGNIQLNGRSGVLVMIDGRQTFLSARDLRNLLESMPAENVKNLEIITNPSAKYEAEGTSGILNINLKKNTQQGLNGSVYAGSTYNFDALGWTAGANLAWKKGRWNSFINADAARRVGGRQSTFTRIFYAPSKTTYFDQVATGNFVVAGPPSVRLGSDYAINPMHSVGVLLSYNTNTGRQEFLSDTWIGQAPKTPATLVEADNYNRNTFSNLTTNLHYNGKLDTSGRLLTADLDFVRIRNRGAADYINHFTEIGTGARTADRLYTSMPGGFNIGSLRLDLTRPLRKGHKIETGTRLSRVESDNDFKFYFNNGALVDDPQRSNHFRYRESIYAAYLNWSGPLSKIFTAQTGLRIEHTRSEGNSITLNQVTRRRYTDFFPSVFVQQKVSPNYGLTYSYSRRLTRPNYGSLNPFKAYRDPYTWSEGNPFLRPQYTNSVSVAQTWKKIYSLTLNYQRHKDAMIELPILDVVNATTVYTTGNIDNNRSIGLTALAPLKISKWWDTQNTSQLMHNRFTTVSNQGPLLNEQLFFMLQSNHTLLLPKAIRMELNMVYRGPAAAGLYHQRGMSRVDVGFRKSVLNKKLDLYVNANDVFKGYRFRWTTDINGNVNDFDQYFRFRSIGVSLRYNFSKGAKVEDRRNRSVDEVNRT